MFYKHERSNGKTGKEHDICAETQRQRRMTKYNPYRLLTLAKNNKHENERDFQRINIKKKTYTFFIRLKICRIIAKQVLHRVNRQFSGI